MTAEKKISFSFNLIWVVQPLLQKYSVLFDPNQFYIVRHPGPHRGAFRDRHGRRAGDAMDAGSTQRKDFARTNGADADGEVVWS